MKKGRKKDRANEIVDPDTGNKAVQFQYLLVCKPY